MTVIDPSTVDDKVNGHWWGSIGSFGGGASCDWLTRPDRFIDRPVDRLECWLLG